LTARRKARKYSGPLDANRAPNRQIPDRMPDVDQRQLDGTDYESHTAAFQSPTPQAGGKNRLLGVGVASTVVAILVLTVPLVVLIVFSYSFNFDVHVDVDFSFNFNI
jgi:hypothetical protein